MPRNRSLEDRAKRYRLEARYLLGLVGTIPGADEKLVLAHIAESYDDLADRLAGTAETPSPGQGRVMRGLKMDYSVAKAIARSRGSWTQEQLEQAAITLLAQVSPSEADLHDAVALRVRAIQLRALLPASSSRRRQRNEASVPQAGLSQFAPGAVPRGVGDAVNLRGSGRGEDRHRARSILTYMKID